jgi:hypothetical protein
MLTRHFRLLGASVLLLVTLIACSKGLSFPPAIDFDGERLAEATRWQQDGLAGIVWTRPGEKLPGAPLQVGAIVSDKHQTAKALNEWISEHAGQRYYDSRGLEETCRVGVTPLPDGGGFRTYMALIACQTGVGRAACVEADETLAEIDFNACLHNKCEPVCDQGWAKRREALDKLAATVLTAR